MSTFIAHDSVNLNAQCAGGGGGGGGGGNRKEAMLIKIKKKTKVTWSKVIQRTGRFSDVWDVATESSSLVVCIPIVCVP